MSEIDQFDLRLLDILQTDTTLSVKEMADKIGLSGTPCWRRIQRLHEKGYIKKKVAILDRERLNVGTTVFITVRIAHHTNEWEDRLMETVQNIPEIMEFYAISGDIDFLMRAVVPDIKAYDKLYRMLVSQMEYADVSCMFAIEEVKSTTAIPLTYVPH